jgi:hypothetical protein
MALELEGYTRHEIAARIYRTDHTVKAHRKAICEKLDAHSAQQAVSICWANGWVRQVAAVSLLVATAAMDPGSDVRPARRGGGPQIARVQRAEKNVPQPWLPPYLDTSWS